MEKEISIKELQLLISKIKHKNNDIAEIFYKLVEEVGELSKAIRKDLHINCDGNIKNTIEEELYDVIYYVIRLANEMSIDLEECILLKEEINAKKYNRVSMFK